MAAWYCKSCSNKPRPKSRPCPRCCGWCLVHIDLPNNKSGLPYRQPKRAREAMQLVKAREAMGKV